jgi:ribosomal protein S18 acetylase RimI-like enzyme
VQGLARPDLVELLSGWGRPGDVALVAADGRGTRLGAAWYRLWTADRHSHGFVDDRTPELGIAVKPGFRRQGVGTSLFMTLLARAEQDGFSRVSLSVESKNPARRLYARFGFEPVREGDGALTLLDAEPESD